MSTRAVVRRTVIGLTLLAASGGGGRAQVNTLVPDSGVGSKYNIAIRNDTGQPVQFQLRPKDADWTTYTLPAGEKGVYSCTGCGGAFEIRISTAGTVVDYTIMTGALYAIRVNAERQVYDVYKIS